MTKYNYLENFRTNFQMYCIPQTSEIVTNLDEEINQCFEKAKSWANPFILLKGKRKGYEKAKITP